METKNEREMTTNIKKISLDAIIPSYAHNTDAGLDLTTTEEKILEPMERYLFSTKLAFEIEQGYYGSIRDRSGLAVKHGIHVLAGVVDSAYRGEIKVCLINLGNEKVLIEKGDRIAQMIIQPCPHFRIKEIKELSKTDRGEGGFGSTGN